MQKKLFTSKKDKKIATLESQLHLMEYSFDKQVEAYNELRLQYEELENKLKEYTRYINLQNLNLESMRHTYLDFFGEVKEDKDHEEQ